MKSFGSDPQVIVFFFLKKNSCSMENEKAAGREIKRGKITNSQKKKRKKRKEIKNKNYRVFLLFRIQGDLLQQIRY
jgi:hypothetical protein